MDVANIFYAAKAGRGGHRLRHPAQGFHRRRDFVRAYAYTGLDPENENQRQFHSFLTRSGYKVVSKDIRKYGDGRIKANLDIELVVDLMRMAQHIDIAVVVSGDGDFAPAIRAVQQQGVRVEVVSFRGNTSSDLIDVADVFTDISQLARVERGERSGRRVAAEDDLSMTAVPEKETDTGTRRRRGDGRRGERGERAERGERPGARRPAAEVAEGGNIIVLPGEVCRALLAARTRTRSWTAAASSSSRRRARCRRAARSRAKAVVVAVVEAVAGAARGRREGEAQVAVGPEGEPLDEAVLDEAVLEDELLEEEVAPLPQHSTFRLGLGKSVGRRAQRSRRERDPGRRGRLRRRAGDP